MGASTLAEESVIEKGLTVIGSEGQTKTPSND